MSRVIRKTSLVSKIKSYPFDFLLYVNELRLSIDWDEYTVSLALPLGAVLTLVSLVIKVVVNYYDSINTKSSNILFSSDYYQYERLKASLNKRPVYSADEPFTNTIVWLLNSVATLIVAICLLNTYLVFSLSRNYGLLYCKNRPNSPSVVRSSIEPVPFYESILLYIGQFFVGNDADDTEETFEEKSDTEIWQLNVWDPSKFSVYVMIWLNPVNSLLIYKLTATSTSLLFIILACALVSLSMYVLVAKFYTLINDKQILYQEMFTEYNNKFVKPKTTILKKDVVIDSTMGPYDSLVLTDMAPYAFNKTKLFVTHDIKGDAVHEYGQQSDTEKYPASNDYLYDMIQSDNEELMARNHLLNQRLSQYRRDDDDRSWYTSSTPYKPKGRNELHGSPVLRNATPSFSTTPYRRSSVISRTPSPSKSHAMSSLSDRSHRSPSPVRPNRSPRRESIPTNYKSPSHSYRERNSPSRADRSPSSPTRYEFARPSSIYNPLTVTPSTNLHNPNSSLRSPSPTNPYSIRSPSPNRSPRNPGTPGRRY